MQQTVKKYLSVTAIKVQGICETKVLEAIEGKQQPTQAMKEGSAAHEKLAEAMPVMSTEEKIKRIKSGQTLSVRELSIFDSKLHVVGRIDNLFVTGTMEGGSNTAIIVDDKFPNDPSKIYGFTLYYKLQLAAYTAALANSYEYGSICRIVGAKLCYRSRQTNEIISQFDMDRTRIETCAANAGIATENAWSIYRRQHVPEHRRFDVETGEWVRCFCNADREKV